MFLIKQAPLLALTVWIGSAAIGVASEDRQNAGVPDLVLAGVKDGREQLRTGIFSARGRKSKRNTEDSAPHHSNLEIFSAFDRTADILRFDRDESTEVNKGASRSPGRKCCIISPREIVTWTGGRHVVVVQSSPDSVYLRPVQPFEVSVLGLTTWGGLTGYASFEATWKAIARAAPSMVATQKGAQVILEWKNEAKGFQRRLWIDSQQGYAPIRHEILTFDGGVNPGSSDKLLELSQVSWRKQNNIWVPESLVIEEHYNAPAVTRIELAFEWHNVNESVPKELFTPEALKVPPGTLLVNARQKKPIIVRRMGEEKGPTTVYDGFQSLRWAIIIAVASIVMVIGIRWIRTGLLLGRTERRM